MIKFLYSMQFTNEILLDFISCHYKAYRKSKNHTGVISEYQILYNQLRQTQKLNFEKNLSENKKLICANTSFDHTFRKEGFTLNTKFTNANIDLTLDGIEFTGKKKVIPIFITPFEKVTKTDKLFLTLQASFLQREFNLNVEECKIVYGRNLKQTKFKLSSFAKIIKKTTGELNKSVSALTPPIFFKNKHCEVCEFQSSCLEKLTERDDLSLLAGLKPNEILQKNNRGFFSVKQLSYTFRPKKNPYRKRKFLPELKALAIREGKTFIQEILNIPTSENEIFLDIEGIPDRNFYYLIGIIIKTKGEERTHSLWAHNEAEQEKIFIEFITLLQPLKEFTVYHYGSYETQALKTISKVLSSEHQEFLKKIIDSSFNLLNIFTNNIYPPTYSNGLKEIARFLKFEWTEKDASGLQSTIWRYNWEMIENDELKQKLVKYNLEDCRALIKVKRWILEIPKDANEQFENADNVVLQTTFKWGNVNFQLKELEKINKFAYFDYQRSKVFIKTYPKIIAKGESRKKRTSHKNLKPNKVVKIYFPRKCPACKGKSFYRHDKRKRVVIDLKITKAGIRKFITHYDTGRFRCRICNRFFTPESFMEIPLKYGRTLGCWIINCYVRYHISYRKMSEFLKESFEIDFPSSRLNRVKSNFAEFYKNSFKEIITHIKKSSLIHIDETPFGIGKGKGYVWVFTNINTVYYHFTLTRESEFLKEMLIGFKGVLISDFYAGYDSINCPKQRCLIHLIRDINDDMLKNQLNGEFLLLASKFSTLLNEIIETVNRYGLKKRFLKKHKKQVKAFFKYMNEIYFETELNEKWRKRFLSFQDELFTFMDYDGVPWNNNNAEVAIKAVAIYRRNVEGLPTSKGLKEYLTLLGLQQTCKYRGISFFEFLKSGEKSVFKYSEK